LESSGQRLSRYRFEHLLCQKYLYDRLDAVVRADLHEAIGTLLETLYSDQASEIAVKLAWHFEAAGLTGKAVDYLLQAGNRAAGLGAYQEAVSLLRRGLALLETLPESPSRGHQERSFQVALSMSLAAIQRFDMREFGGPTPPH
jgi:predicted ATPase